MDVFNPARGEGILPSNEKLGAVLRQRDIFLQAFGRLPLDLARRVAKMGLNAIEVI